MADQEVRIVDRCPSCGTTNLFVGAGGYLTCSLIGCKQPATGRAIEAMQRDLLTARDALNIAQRGGLLAAVESLGAELAQANERFGHLSAVAKFIAEGKR